MILPCVQIARIFVTAVHISKQEFPVLILHANNSASSTTYISIGIFVSSTAAEAKAAVHNHLGNRRITHAQLYHKHHQLASVTSSTISTTTTRTTPTPVLRGLACSHPPNPQVNTLARGPLSTATAWLFPQAMSTNSIPRSSSTAFVRASWGCQLKSIHQSRQSESREGN